MGRTYAKAIALTAGLGLVLSAGIAGAQRSGWSDPVNLPPADYTGVQFVDNAGCVFMRAGYDGAVQWVPRVTRSRDQVCGQTPTFGAGAGTQVAATPATPAPAPTTPAPVANIAAVQTPVTVAPTPAPARPASNVASNPASSPTSAAMASSGPGLGLSMGAQAPYENTATASRPSVPQRETAMQTAKATAAPPRLVRPVPVTAPGASAPTRAAPTELAMIHAGRVGYLSGPVGGAPQAAATGSAASGARSSGVQRVVPAHLQAQAMRPIAPIPPGYRPVWTDDRLNPFRAWQTPEGIQQANQHWAETVPRVPVGQASSQGMGLAASQQYVTVTLPGTPTATASAKGRGTYVEVGVFAAPDRARAAIARLGAEGLPVSSSQERDGVTRVRLGPYGSTEAGLRAMHSAQAAGYPGAHLR